VLVDQYIDRTRGRPSTFFDEFGIVAHVGFADPVDAALSSAVHAAATEAGARVHQGGVYVCMDGPQFSTRAESVLYRSWSADVIGMTNLPEAKLAREAELPYASMALVTDYDCWRVSEEAVHVEAVLEVLQRNVAMARAVIRALVPRLPDPAQSPAASALANAILTAPAHVPSEVRRRLAPLLAKYLPA
jgi:5'-methylthioadenosine phosphorylase